MRTSVKRKSSFDNGQTPSGSSYNSKRTHFNTPLKQSYTDLASSPFTPGSTPDNIFQSVPKPLDEDYSLLSSPPPITSSTIKRTKNFQNLIDSTPLKLSLSIGKDGRAFISRSQLKILTPSENGTSNSNGITSNDHINSFETPTKGKNIQKGSNENINNSKREILSLLKRMRSGTNSVESPTKKKLSYNIQPSSPPTVIPPRTPRVASLNNLMRTGLTPSFRRMDENMVPLDQILLDTDKVSSVQKRKHMPDKSVLITTGNEFSISEHTEHFPFKNSVGDPLLINDDEQWIQIMKKSSDHANISEVRKLNDYSKKVITFDNHLLEEPSTPRTHSNNLAFDLSSSISIQDKKNSNNAILNRGVENGNITLTPLQRQSSLQFTPLIQQTMTGSLSNKVSPKILFSPKRVLDQSTTNSTNLNYPSNSDEVEASTVLRRLITGFN